MQSAQSIQLSSDSVHESFRLSKGADRKTEQGKIHDRIERKGMAQLQKPGAKDVPKYREKVTATKQSAATREEEKALNFWQ